MSNIECEKEFARRAALNPIASNSRELKMNDTVARIIQLVMEKYPRDTPGSNAKYFEAVHQELAPFARELELQAALDALDAKRYRTIKTMALMDFKQWEKLDLLIESIRNQFQDGMNLKNYDILTDACTALLAQQAGDTK